MNAVPRHARRRPVIEGRLRVGARTAALCSPAAVLQQKEEEDRPGSRTLTTTAKCAAHQEGRTASDKDTAQRLCPAGMPTPSKKKKKKKASGKGAGKGGDDETKVERDPIFGLLHRPSAIGQPKVEPRDNILVDKAYIETFNGRYKYSVRTPTGCVRWRLPLLHCWRWRDHPADTEQPRTLAVAPLVCVLRAKPTVSPTGRKVAPGLRSTFTGHRTGRSSGSFAAASLPTSRYAAPTLKAMTCAPARATGAGRKIARGSHTR